MTLPGEALERIGLLVRCGFHERDEIIERIMELIDEEQICEGGKVGRDEVEQAVDAAIKVREADKARWPKVTDNDRLDGAFGALERRGIIALQNAGVTQSDGIDDVAQVLHDPEYAKPKVVIGYCFYHWQDLERAVNGEGLMFAFGPIDSDKEESEGPKIGRIIVEELERAGFKAEWDGTFDHRIGVPVFDWKRR